MTHQMSVITKVCWAVIWCKKTHCSRVVLGSASQPPDYQERKL